MKDQFVTYEIALKLKELGFNEKCFGYYHINEGYKIGYAFCYSQNTRTSDCSILTPLWQQALKFLHTKLDFFYPFIRLIIYEDNSGCWYKSPDNGDEEIEFEFGNLEEAVLTAIELCQKQY